MNINFANSKGNWRKQMELMAGYEKVVWMVKH